MFVNFELDRRSHDFFVWNLPENSEINPYQTERRISVIGCSTHYLIRQIIELYLFI